MKNRLIVLVVSVVLGWASVAHAAPFTLTWSDQSTNETGFKVYRQSNGADFSLEAEVGADVETFQQDIPLDNNTYCYRVTAFNAAGESSPSNADCVVRQAMPPSAPTSLTVTATVPLQPQS